MNEKILISYIIPAYNAADTLERAVESITHTCNMEKCEILIVENGSTDYTNSVALKLIQKYGENVKLIHSEKGVSRARNEGLKNARGEWIVFVDADDYIVSKSKKYIYEDILNAKADLYVYSYEIGNRANYINNKEEKTYYFNDSAEKMKLEMIANPTKFMQVWGKIFRKSIIYENRIGFNTKMQLSEDSDFTLHYLMHCSRISISDTIFYHYSIDNESTMRSNADKKVLQYIEAMNITSKYIEKQHENVQLAFNDYILIDYVPSRNNSRVAKAPQSFWLDDILKAHEKALSEGEKNCIDSCTMMQRYGYDLYLIDGPGENIKITTPEDFYTMRAILEAKENEQIYGLE